MHKVSFCEKLVQSGSTDQYIYYLYKFRRLNGYSAYTEPVCRTVCHFCKKDICSQQKHCKYIERYSQFFYYIGVFYEFYNYAEAYHTAYHSNSLYYALPENLSYKKHNACTAHKYSKSFQLKVHTSESFL